MTVIVKSAANDVISIPASLIEQLGLRDGDRVKTSIEGGELRVIKLNRFLALRGALADDATFDQAMKQMDEFWQSWTTPASA